MSGDSDRRAPLLLVALLAAGLVVRLLVGAGAAPGSIGFRAAPAARPERDSLAAGSARLARPLGSGERIDVDRASATELTRLPRIGPALAARIVTNRDAEGPFGSLEELDRVSGVGPALLGAIRPHAAFSGPSRRPPEPQPPGIVTLNTATARDLAQLPAIGPSRARAIVEDRERRGPYRRLEDLIRVPGIGRGTIERLRGRVRVP